MTDGRRWHLAHLDGSEWTVEELREWMWSVYDVDFEWALIDEYGAPFLADGDYNHYPFTSTDVRVVFDG